MSSGSGEAEDAELALAAKSLELAQLQRTHDEYVKSSCEYERELEVEVDRYEKKTQALTQAVDRAELERLAVQSKLEEASIELEVAREKHEALLAVVQDMKWKIQRLEQSNDELETAARVAQASVGNLEHKADRLLEQTVLLQHEKEELQRQLASIVVAEVHPTPTHLVPLTSQASRASSRGPSLRFSRQSSSHVLIEVAATALAADGGTGKALEITRKTRARGSYPDVVESCLHLTCRQCRALGHGHQLQHALREASEPKSALGFFERVRLKLFGPDELSVALALALVLAVTGGAPCTSKDLSVFKEVETSVKQCSVATGMSIQLPPQSQLTKSDKSELCNSKACLAMLGAIDDLSLPRCDVAFNKQNMTLQTSLDRFASLCDESGSAPAPIKKKKSGSSSASGSSSGSSGKPTRRQKSAAATSGYSASSMALVTVVTLVLLLAQTLA